MSSFNQRWFAFNHQQQQQKNHQQYRQQHEHHHQQIDNNKKTIDSMDECDFIPILSSSSPMNPSSVLPATNNNVAIVANSCRDRFDFSFEQDSLNDRKDFIDNNSMVDDDEDVSNHCVPPPLPSNRKALSPLFEPRSYANRFATNFNAVASIGNDNGGFVAFNADNNKHQKYDNEIVAKHNDDDNNFDNEVEQNENQQPSGFCLPQRLAKRLAMLEKKKFEKLAYRDRTSTVTMRKIGGTRSSPPSMQPPSSAVLIRRETMFLRMKNGGNGKQQQHLHHHHHPVVPHTPSSKLGFASNRINANQQQQYQQQQSVSLFKQPKTKKSTKTVNLDETFEKIDSDFNSAISLSPSSSSSSSSSSSCTNLHKVVNNNNNNNNKNTVPPSSSSLSSPSAFDNEQEDFRYMNWFNSVIKFSFTIENQTNSDLRRIVGDAIVSVDHISNDNHASSAASTSAAAAALPLKDGISSMAYKEAKMMESLREKASRFYTTNMSAVKEILLEDLKIPRFYIRKDRNIHADVGAKKFILELFLQNYNPLWLKMALECVFDVRINTVQSSSSLKKNTSTNNEMRQLVHTLTSRLISFKELALRRGYKNTVTYFMKEQNVIAAKRHILYNFLLIVHFLDIAKRARLIDHDPCLFRVDAQCKSSRDVVIALSREYITGVGDITKALRSVGIHLQHVQQPIEEFNFSVQNLAVDLRCGVRLARLLEIILQRNNILTMLQFPPDSITRKLHNMEVVFSVVMPHINAAANGIPPLPDSVTPRDLVNGWRKKTITFLDRLIALYNVQMRLIELKQHEQSAILIQRFWRRVRQCRRERSQFLAIRSAAIVIQRHYRNVSLARPLCVQYRKIRTATLVIQHRFRAWQAMRHDRSRFLSLRSATIVIQRTFRACLAMRVERRNYLRQRSAIITIQQWYKSKHLMMNERENFVQLRANIIKLQANIRGWLARQRVAELRRQTQAAITIQRFLRANKLMHIDRQKFVHIRQAVVVIQTHYRARCAMIQARADYIQKRSAAITIQRYYRGSIQWKKYQQLRSNVMTIQHWYRSRRCALVQREKFLRIRLATITIQQWYRSVVAMRAASAQYHRTRLAVITIQCTWRMYVQTSRYRALKRATIVIQQRWRALIQCRRERENFLRTKAAVVVIQRQIRHYLWHKHRHQAAVMIQKRVREWLATRRASKQFQHIRSAVVTIQHWYRATMLAREERARYVERRSAAILIQRWYRNKKRGTKFLSILFAYMEYRNQAASTIQRVYRGYRVRHQMELICPLLAYTRQRVQQAQVNAIGKPSFQSIVYTILERISRVRSINHLYKDIEKLEEGTTYSVEICRLICDNDWVIMTLVAAFDGLNRSEPHKNVILNIMGIFLNVLRRTKCEAKSLFRNEELLEVAIKMIRQHSKTESIITRSILLLIELFQDSATLKLFQSNQSSLATLMNFIDKSLKNPMTTTSSSSTTAPAVASSTGQRQQHPMMMMMMKRCNSKSQLLTKQQLVTLRRLICSSSSNTPGSSLSSTTTTIHY